MNRDRTMRRSNLLPGLDDGHVSSGSDHDAHVLDGIFLSDEEEEDNAVRHDNAVFSPPLSSTAGVVKAMVKEAAADPFAAALTSAVERLNGPGPPRVLMGRLRDMGYNAGLCKVRWEAPGGSGSYEYVDVLRDDTWQRYLVEVDFKGQFEIARPTAEFGRVLAELPLVYVARPEALRRLVRVLADAAKRSLQSRELHVAPWRKSQYMQAKWLGPYRRTTNHVPVAAAPPAGMTCRVSGFYWGVGVTG